MNTIAIEKSQDRKLSRRGNVSATYAPQQTCPQDCPLLGAGCYAEVGHVGIHTRRLNKKAQALARRMAKGKKAA